MTPAELQASRIRGRPDLPRAEDSVIPPTIEIDPRFESAFRQQAENIRKYNEEFRRWWNDYVVRKTKE